MPSRSLADRVLGFWEEEQPISALLALAEAVEDLDRRVQELEQGRLAS